VAAHPDPTWGPWGQGPPKGGNFNLKKLVEFLALFVDFSTQSHHHAIPRPKPDNVYFGHLGARGDRLGARGPSM